MEIRLLLSKAENVFTRIAQFKDAIENMKAKGFAHFILDVLENMEPLRQT